MKDAEQFLQELRVLLEKYPTMSIDVVGEGQSRTVAILDGYDCIFEQNDLNLDSHTFKAKEDELQRQAKQEIDAWMKSDKTDSLRLLGVSLDNVIEYLRVSHNITTGSADSYDTLGYGVELYGKNQEFYLDVNFECRAYIEISINNI